MKIMMFGRGTIAAVYGWALERAGHEVEFFVRPGRAAEYGETIQLDLLDARRRMLGERVREAWPVRFRESLQADHDFDLIVVSVAHDKLAAALEYLAPRIGNATILIFGNVWADPQEITRQLPAVQLAWGFPAAGGAFGEDGVLHAGLLPVVIFGTFGAPPTARELAVREVFRGAGLRIQERSDFRAWLWVHFISDAGLHAEGLRLGTLSNLAGSRRAFREGFLGARELLPLLAARGIDLRANRGATRVIRAPMWLVAPGMAWASRHIALFSINFAAHSDYSAAEPTAICRDALAEARRLGVPAPRLEAAEPYFASA